MEEIEIINLWKAYDQKLSENLSFSKENAIEITKLKAQSLLSSMKPTKIFTILVGIIWVSFVNWLILSFYNVANPFFLISAAIQSLLSMLAIGVYIYQYFLIQRVDISEPIVKTQEKIATLKTSTLWVTRFLFLQLPVWTTFYWNKSMLENGNLFLLIFQGIITTVTIFAAIWLFFNIKYENKDKKWFKILFSGKEWNPLMASMEMLEQIKEYK